MSHSWWPAVVAWEVKSRVVTDSLWNQRKTNGDYYCAHFDVKNNGAVVYSNKEYCDCVLAGDADDWLTDYCVLVNSEGEIENLDDVITCEIVDSPTLVDSHCGDIGPPDPGALDGTDGDDCGLEVDWCDQYAAGTHCCCTLSDPICCDDPYGGDGCIGTVMGDPAYTAPGNSPDHSATLVSGQVELTVHPGTGDEDSDSVSASATASYSFGDCGSSLCAFYLADLVFETNDTISVDVTVSSVTKTKNIVNFHGRLAYPTFGTYDPSSDDVEFPPDTLVFSIRYEVAGQEFSTENGSYAVVARNEQTVTGTADDSTHLVTLDNLSFGIDVPNVDPVAELSYSSVSLTGSPPSVSGTVSSVDCIATNQGRVNFDGTSTDPDSDLAVEMWWIDGELEHVGSDTFRIDFTNGAHVYKLRAIDARGAFRDIDDEILVGCQ